MRIAFHVMSAPAPLGLLLLATTDQGVRHIEFMDRRSLKRTLAVHGPATPEVTWEMSLHGLRPLADQIDAMLTGARRTFDWRLDLGTDPLQSAVARALLAVPYGQTTTVAAIARTLGRPRDTKAIADAIEKNPLALLVPCHRVVGADGKPSAYVGGLPRKKFMLDLEARFSRMGGLDDNRVIGDLVRHVPRAVSPARVAIRKPATQPAAGKSARHTITKPTSSKVGSIVKPAKTAIADRKPKAAAAAASKRTAATRVMASAKKRSR